MKEQIRQRARELGFDDCRFTTAAPPDHADEFQNWLAQHQHGEMAWLERNAPKRVEPKRVLAGARSVIALAVSYVQGPMSKGPIYRDRLTTIQSTVVVNLTQAPPTYARRPGVASLWYMMPPFDGVAMASR